MGHSILMGGKRVAASVSYQRHPEVAGGKGAQALGALAQFHSGQGHRKAGVSGLEAVALWYFQHCPWDQAHSRNGIGEAAASRLQPSGTLVSPGAPGPALCGLRHPAPSRTPAVLSCTRREAAVGAQ